MGREAACICDWGGTKAQVKVLIEPPDLIVRGAIRRRLPLTELRKVHVDGGLLRFEFGGENISIEIGTAHAAAWAQALLAPPPSLARKLGITAESRVRMLGVVDDAALRDALETAGQVSKNSGDLVLARVGTARDLLQALKASAPELEAGRPIWFIYPKGRSHMLTESDVRAMGLRAGLVDTKVAAVSPVLTALRFVKRNAPPSK